MRETFIQYYPPPTIIDQLFHIIFHIIHHLN